MAQTEVLLNDVPLFGYLLVSVYLIFGQLGRGRILPHDPILDLIQTEKAAIRFTKVSFIGIDNFNGLIHMTTG